jgi:hypothetical protein
MNNHHELNAQATIDYAYCPPASGTHWNIAGLGPIPRNFYGPEVEKPPGGWVHDLEHGFLVAAYSCKNGCPSADELAALKQWMDSVPSTPGAVKCQVPNKVLVVRFDAMATKYAFLVWDRALLMDKFDPATATEFANQWIDPPQAPEQGLCVGTS